MNDSTDWDEFEEDDDLDVFDCPDCGAELHAEAEACPACGYWVTDADREAGWTDSSTSQRIRSIGLWVIGLAAIGTLLLWWD